MAKKVALVTGSQQGIGFTLVKMLCGSFDGDVIVTGMTEAEATEARTKLEGQGVKPVSHQLDIRDQKSVDQLAAFVKEKYGGLDVLVNNAGINFGQVEQLRVMQRPVPKELDSFTPAEIAEKMCDVNFFGTLRVCEAMFPLLRPGARVVHLASRAAGYTLNRSSEANKARMTKAGLTVDEVKELVTEYQKDVMTDNYKAKGWPEHATAGMNHWALIALAAAQQAAMDKDSRKDIIVNAVCPGQTATEGTNFVGQPVEQGCDTPFYLATLPANADSPKGSFVADRKVMSLDKPNDEQMKRGMQILNAARN